MVELVFVLNVLNLVIFNIVNYLKVLDNRFIVFIYSMVIDLGGRGNFCKIKFMENIYCFMYFDLRL